MRAKLENKLFAEIDKTCYCRIAIMSETINDDKCLEKLCSNLPLSLQANLNKDYPKENYLKVFSKLFHFKEG